MNTNMQGWTVKVEGPAPNFKIVKDSNYIAAIYMQPDDEKIARLIAAAPELLTALEKMVRAADRLPGNNALEGITDEARAAIEKATKG